jgi:hypothetical protein
MALMNCFLSPASEDPRRFPIRFVFAKLGAETCDEIKHKNFVTN